MFIGFIKGDRHLERERAFPSLGIPPFSKTEFLMAKRILVKRKKIKEFSCAVIFPTDEDQL